MKSSFGSKRKPRKIQVDEDDEEMQDVNNTPESIVTSKYHYVFSVRSADTVMAKTDLRI